MSNLETKRSANHDEAFTDVVRDRQFCFQPATPCGLQDTDSLMQLMVTIVKIEVTRAVARPRCNRPWNE